MIFLESEVVSDMGLQRSARPSVSSIAETRSRPGRARHNSGGKGMSWAIIHITKSSNSARGTRIRNQSSRDRPAIAHAAKRTAAPRSSGAEATSARELPPIRKTRIVNAIATHGASIENRSPRAKEAVLACLFIPRDSDNLRTEDNSSSTAGGVAD